mgnify:CR=1 FL=1
MRAARSFTEKVPKPTNATESPSFKEEVTAPVNASRARVAAALEISALLDSYSLLFCLRKTYLYAFLKS